jgi:7-carboxy-7-deazaguanine synthase
MLKITTQPQRLAELSEIFSSLQGEGPYLGQKQIFVRFGRCQMHCGYCDETEKMQPINFKTLSLSQVMKTIETLDAKEGMHHTVSLTGGEPLLYSEFLSSLLPSLKEAGKKIYLETNGTLPGALKRHISMIDIVAMDMKPPSSTGDRAFWREHEDFLKVASEREVFVKIVVTSDTDVKEIDRCINIICSVDSGVTLVFQPESESEGINLTALERIRQDFVDRALLRLEDVRVIPQLHKIWGVR